MSLDLLTTREIYMRHTSVDGTSYVASHVVWDADTFIAARQREAAKLNAGQKGNEPRMAAAQQITQEQYLKERTK